jgi:hypothetical protein
MDIVSVDIGGTHARFTIANLGDDGKVTLGKVETLHTKDHASFESAWAHFAEINGAPCPARRLWRLPGRSTAIRSNSPTTLGDLSRPVA